MRVQFQSRLVARLQPLDSLRISKGRTRQSQQLSIQRADSRPRYGKPLAWDIFRGRLEERAKAEGSALTLLSNFTRDLLWSVRSIEPFSREEYDSNLANHDAAWCVRRTIDSLMRGISTAELNLLDEFASAYGRTKPIIEMLTDVATQADSPTDIMVEISASEEESLAVHRLVRFVRLLGVDTAAYLLRQIDYGDFVDMVAYLALPSDAAALFRLVERLPDRKSFFDVIIRGQWRRLGELRLTDREWRDFQFLVQRLEAISPVGSERGDLARAVLKHGEGIQLHPLLRASSPYERLRAILEMLQSEIS